MTLQFNQFKFVTLAFAILLFANSCSSSSSNPDELATGGGTGGGIGGSGLVLGDVDGFGSIVIGGVTYGTDNAAINASGISASQSDLRVGMNVRAVIDKDTNEAVSVNYFPVVLGPVSSAQLAAGRFDIFNQTVLVNNNTVLDGVSLNAGAANAIADNSVIEVSGIRDANGQIIASYIRPAADGAAYQLQGVVEEAQNGEGQLQVSGESIDVAGVDPSMLGAGASEGRTVQLILVPDGSSAGPTVLDGNTLIVFNEIKSLEDLQKEIQLRFEGYIQVNVFGGILILPELTVFVSDSTTFTFADGSAATSNDLGLNSRVIVTAITNFTGLINANNIVILEK